MSLNQLLNPVKELNVKFDNVDLSTINNEPYPPSDDNKKITTLGSIGGNIEPADNGNVATAVIDANDVFVEQLKNTIIGGTEYSTTRIYCCELKITSSAALVVPENVVVIKINIPSKLASSICKYAVGDLQGITNAGVPTSASLACDDTQTGYLNLGFIVGDPTNPTTTPLKVSTLYAGNFDLHLLTPVA